MIKTVFLLMFVCFSYLGKAQTFCDTMFGFSFKLESKLHDSNELFSFEEDTIDFYQYKQLSNYVIFDLNCSDSTFEVSSVEEFFDTISGDYIFLQSKDFGNNGNWKLNAVSKIISFKMKNTKKWYSYRLIQKGSVEDNPFRHPSNVGDCRYLISLIPIKSN